jgi:hypothetical protein
MDALDFDLLHLLSRPSRASQILISLAAALRNEDPLAPLTLNTLNRKLHYAVETLAAWFPAEVVEEAQTQASRALPSIHPGETPDAYALRILTIARGL